MTFLLVDTYNLMHRAKHVTRSSTEDKISLGFHIILYSLLNCWKIFDAKHVVFALEGKSWRREIYEDYKASRRVLQAQRSANEIIEDLEFDKAVHEFINFLNQKTNVTVLQSNGLEADDLIARWTQRFKNHKHIIISADSDFQQLICHNIKLYNGIKNEIWTHEGVFDIKGNLILNKKTNKPIVVEPEWFLFKKIMRGDPSDNIMSAYPGVRETKLRSAFEDRHNKGFNWNALMQQQWKDHLGKTHRVLDCYYKNRELIDLTAQPKEIIQLADSVIDASIAKPKVNGVGIWFLQFAHLHGLNRLSKNPQQISNILNAKFEEFEEINAN